MAKWNDTDILAFVMPIQKARPFQTRQSVTEIL